MYGIDPALGSSSPRLGTTPRSAHPAPAESALPPDGIEPLMDPNTDDLKGRAKEAVGDLTDNRRLKNEGKADRASGKAKEIVDDLKDKAEHAIDKVKDALERD